MVVGVGFIVSLRWWQWILGRVLPCFCGFLCICRFVVVVGGLPLGWGWGWVSLWVYGGGSEFLDKLCLLGSDFVGFCCSGFASIFLWVCVYL